MASGSQKDAARSSSAPGLRGMLGDEDDRPRYIGGKKHRRVLRRQMADDEADDPSEADYGQGTSTASRFKRMVVAPFAMSLHLVSEKRSPLDGRKTPFRAPPGKFQNLGEFVQHHRDQQLLMRGAPIPEVTSEPGPPVAEVAQEPPPQPPAVEEEQEEVDPVELFEDSVAALHRAALANEPRRVRLLLSGPDPIRNLPSPDLPLGDSNETPALKAARNGCGAACAALLDGRADPLVRDSSLRYFGDGVWPHEQRPDRYGSVEPKDPRDHGALPGRTVVYWLHLTGQFRAVLSAVFPMTRVSLVRSIVAGIQDHFGEPALVVAARDGNAELTSLLLAHTSAGLPPLAPVISGWATGSAWATSSAAWGATAGPAASTTATSTQWAGAPGAGSAASWSTGYTTSAAERSQALLMACCQKEWRIAHLLIGAGVPAAQMAMAKDRLGRTALHIAAAFGAVEVVRALVRAGHPLRVVSYRGRQPLHEACAVGCLPVAAALLEGRADPLALTDEDRADQPAIPGRRESRRGLTAQEVAAAKGHAPLCALLAEYSSRGTGAGERSQPSKAGPLPVSRSAPLLDKPGRYR